MEAVSTFRIHYYFQLTMAEYSFKLSSNLTDLMYLPGAKVISNVVKY